MMKENKQENENKKKNLINLIIEIILIIIIILLLLHSCGLMYKEKNKKVPTGNVDIIEIKCDNKDTCKKESKDDKNNTVPTIAPVNPDEEKEEEDKPIEGFIVEDDNHDTIHWNGAEDLRIFTDPAYEFRKKIAPESSNSYKFVVKNKSNYKLKYKITFTETNQYNINLKYKLKKNGDYIVSDYVPYNGVDIENQIIEIDGEDTYYLDWKWISSSNDTYIGKIQADYKLKIEVEAESVYE